MTCLIVTLSFWQAVFLNLIFLFFAKLTSLTSFLLGFLLLGLLSISCLLFCYYIYNANKKMQIQLDNCNDEVHALQKLLYEKNEELELFVESNIRLSQFAYVASHDLKSSLNTIKSFSSLLKLTICEILNPKEQEYLNYIEKAASASEILVMDTLYYAQVQATPLQLKQVNVTVSINYLLSSMKYSLDKRKAVIRVGHLPEKIKADEKQLRKIFEVLLSNAIKFMPLTRIPIIHINSEENEKEWIFKISDNGIGLKQEHEEKIFGEFVKLNSKYEYSGTGLGLAIGKNIVEKHDGRIWLADSSDKGSTFAFSINK